MDTGISVISNCVAVRCTVFYLKNGVTMKTTLIAFQENVAMGTIGVNFQNSSEDYSYPMAL